MGGYSLGELFGSLSLDDSQFTSALERAGGASRLMSANMQAVGNSITELYAQMDKAGYSADFLVTELNKLYQKGLTASQSAEVLAKSMTKVQDRAKSLGLIINKSISTELENYRALIAAEDIRTRKLQEEYKKQQDYASLVKRLREEEQAGIRQQIAATNEGFRQEAAYRKQRDTERTTSELNYRNLVERLAKEEADAKIKYQKIAENDAIQRQKEIQQQMLGEVAAQERIARETVEAKARAERKAYSEYWHTSRVAEAATTSGMYAMAAGAAGVGAGVFVAKQAADFQDAMVKSLAIVGEADASTKAKMAQTARDLAKETGEMAKEIASDYAVLAKGGIVAADSINQLPIMVKYAVANEVELHAATKQVLNVMESMKLSLRDTKKVTDEFTLANKLANGSVDVLTAAIEGRAGSALRNARVSLEQALAITVLYTKAGIESSQAQTYIAQTINQLTKSATTYKDTMLKVNGVNTRWGDIVYDGSGKMRSFVDILKILNTAFAGRDQKSIDGFFNSIALGGARGAQGLKVLLGQSDILDKLEKAFKSAGGQVQETFDVQLQSPIRQLDILKRKMEDVFITLGIPVVSILQSMATTLKPTAEGMADLVAKFAGLPPWMQQTILLGGGVTSGLLLMGGTALVAAGSVLRLYGDLKLLAASGAITSLQNIGGAITMYLLAPLGTVAAVLGVIYGYYKLVEKASNDLKSKETSTFWGKSLVGSQLLLQGSMFNFPKSSLGTASAPKKEEKETPVTNIADIGKNTVDALRKSLEDALPALKDTMGEIQDALSFDPKKIEEKAISFQNITTALNTFREKVKAGLYEVGDETEAVYQQQINRIEKIAQGGNVKRALSDLAQLRASFELQQNEESKLRDEARAQEEAAHKIKELDDKLEKAELSNLKTMDGYWKRLHDSMYDSSGILRTIEITTDLINKKSGGSRTALAQISNLEGRISDELLNVLVRGSQVEDIMRKMGRSSQTSLHTAAVDAEIYYNKLVELGAAPEDVATAWVYWVEAIARENHVSAQSISKDYERIKDSITDSVRKGHSEWIRSLSVLRQDLRRVVGTFATGLMDLAFPADTSSNVSALTTTLRDAYSSLSAYSDPANALQQIIDKIKSAGSTAEANAIAIKYFGDSVGPTLAGEIRSGKISVSELNAAIKDATKSTSDYEKQTNTSTSGISQVWNETARQIKIAITKYIIEQGFVSMLKWVFKIQDSTRDLGKVMTEVWSKIVDAIKSALGITKKVADETINAAGTVTSTASKTGTVASTVGGVGGGGGGVGSAAGSAVSAGVGGIINIVTGVITAISSVFGNVQMHAMNKTLDLIEKSTRYTEIYVGEQSDSILSTVHLMRDYLQQIIANTAGMIKISLSGVLNQDQVNSLMNNLINGSLNFYSGTYGIMQSINNGIISGTAQIVGQLHLISKALNPPLWKSLLSGGSLGGIVSGVGSAAGSIGMALNPIAGIISGIAGLFSGSGSDTGKIEENTRGILNEALNNRADQWAQHYGVVSKFEMIYARLGDMWNTMMNRVGEGVTATTVVDTSGVLGSIQYSSTLILSKLDLFLVPYLASIRDNVQAIRDGGSWNLGAAGASGGGNITIGTLNVQSSNAADLVRQLKALRVV